METRYHRFSALPLLFILIFSFCSILVYGDEEEMEDKSASAAIKYHSLGDQSFAINAGLAIPLFFENPNQERLLYLGQIQTYCLQRDKLLYLK